MSPCWETCYESVDILKAATHTLDRWLVYGQHRAPRHDYCNRSKYIINSANDYLTLVRREDEP